MAVQAPDVYYKEMTLSSNDFRTGNINQPIFYFDTFIDSLDKLSITRVIIPTTYYVFTAPNYVSMTINGTAVSWPPGNYLCSEWIAIVQPQVPAVVITFSEITGRLTFTNANTTITFSSTQLAWQLLGMTANGTNGTIPTSFTTPFSYNFSGPNYCYLRSRMASVFNGTNLYFSKPLSDNSPEDKMILVPINQNRNSVVNYVTVADRYFDWFDSSTRQVDFYCTLGERNEVMDFNGVAFQVVLTGFSHRFDHSSTLTRNIVSQGFSPGF